jgi:hypothetical protein
MAEEYTSKDGSEERRWRQMCQFAVRFGAAKRGADCRDDYWIARVHNVTYDIMCSLAWLTFDVWMCGSCAAKVRLKSQNYLYYTVIK